MKLIKWLLAAVLTLTPSLGVAQANSFWTDRAVGVSQFNGFSGLVPISYGQVRVCTMPTVGSPCNTPANVFDINGTLLPINGGNFGQVTTDIVGRYSLQAASGNYLIQVAATGSNTPQLSYPITIGNTSSMAKVFEGFRFADQFSGANSGAQIQNACIDAGTNGAVIAPFGMASGDPASLVSGCYVMDYRSGNNLRLFIGTGAAIREVSSYATNIGADNPFGRYQVYSEIGTTPNTNGIPLGNDLTLVARASADIHSKTVALDTTSTTSVAAPGSVTITVGATANLYTGAGIIIDPGAANEETILSAGWSKPTGTTITATFTKTHAQPYTVRQIGAIFLDTGLIKITGDGKNPFVSFLDGQSNIVFMYPVNIAAAAPNNAVQWSAIQTGANGTNKNLIYQMSTTLSAFLINNNANLGSLFSLTESGGAAVLKLGNSTNQSMSLQAAADTARLFGGGTSGGMNIYGVQTGAGTSGDIRIRNNPSDEAQIASITGATGNINTIGQFVSTKATGTAPLVVSSTTPVANLTTVPATYIAAGTQQTATHLVIGRCTLGTDCSVTLSGAAIFTSSSSYQCNAVDTTALAAVRFVPSSGSAFALTGTGTDVLSYTCTGN